MLKLQNIRKKYGHKVIFENASYEFNPGLYFLIGQNGAGKSTFLKIIAGIDQGYDGVVEGKNIFYLPEKLILPKELMTYQLINQYSRINDSMGSFIELVTSYNLENLPIKKLSKGMIQKVGIIISLLDKYNIILYDEPLEGLDEAAIKQFFIDLKKLKNTIVIMSIHEIPKGIRVNAQKIYIKDGKLCE